MKSKRTSGMSAFLLAQIFGGQISADLFKEIPRPTRTPKRTGPLAEQLKANAAAKRERKAKRLKWGYYFCVKNNPCLKETGKNFLTAE